MPRQGELGAARELTAELLPVPGNLITGDTLYCQREYCRQIREAGGDYLVVVKKNQPELYEDIALAFGQRVWRRVWRGEYREARRDNRHGGRRERRRLWATGVLNGYLDWPGVGQVCRVESLVREKGKSRKEVRCVITSLGDEVSAGKLLEYVRGHWEIENRLHWVRDVTLGEDASRVRVGAAPQVMAVLRNIMLGLLRSCGCQNIAGRCAG